MSAFDYFVVFAEMRTGSNFLEANINKFDGLTCHGEAFNPHFIGYPNTDNVLGIGQAERDADPLVLLDAIKTRTKGLGGFRFFNDHDPRVLDAVLADPRCAKIVLTRNPVDSFVSWKIAAATGQWKLTNAKHAKAEQITFDPDAFAAHLEDLQAFQVRLLNSLQRSGQTAFYVAYEDLQDVAVMNGLARFLGHDGEIPQLDKKLKKQNPQPMSEKVANFTEMEAALARLDRFNLSRTPNFEPRRGPNVRGYVVAPESPLLYLPIKSGPEDVVIDWLARLDGKGPEAVRSSFNQNELGQWKVAHPGHRSFAVLRHPVARAHAAFCDRILSQRTGSFPEVRETLRKVYNVPIPDHGAKPETDPEYTMDAHRAAFLAWLQFLKGNLAGQTNLRVDPAWATQFAVLQGYAEFAMPDLIVREAHLQHDLAILANKIGRKTMPAVAGMTDPHMPRLAVIYNREIEAATRQAYARDYAAFGFENWSPR